MQPGKKAAFALTLAVFAVTWLSPLWPAEQALHSSLTVMGLIWLWRHDRRWPMRTRHFVLICLFICVHSVAARWLYSNFPYDRWLQALLGWSPDQAFGWQRNHTDRLIHLLYGVCFAPALRHYLGQRWPLNPRQAFGIAIMLIMCSSLIYEWLEWGIALTLSPEAAESYNGQQGDAWDAHADMLLATLGALVAWPRGSSAALSGNSTARPAKP
jgi:putative membrane protein